MTSKTEKDMVVLKRNDPDDANFENKVTGIKYFVGSAGDIYFWCGDWERCHASFKIEKLKPIKEEVMKEYLTKNSSGSYQLVNHRFSGDDIEVPQGANYAATNGHGIFFSDKNDFIPDLVVWVRESLNDKTATVEVARQEEKHNHYKKDVSHLNVIDPYRIADLYNLHPCADHIMKKSLCAGNRGHKDTLRDIQDIIDTAERWKQMIEEDNNEI